MSLNAEYALAQYRAAQHRAPDLPLPGTHDWHTVADVRDAYRVAQRTSSARGGWRSLAARLVARLRVVARLRANVPRPRGSTPRPRTRTRAR